MNKLILILFLLLPGVNSVIAQITTTADSVRVERVFDDYLREFLKLNPEEATSLGLPESSGYEYDHGALNDGSPVGIKANLDLARKYLKELQSVDISKVGKSQIIDIRILIWLLELQLEGEEFIDDGYGIDYLTGAFPKVLNLLTGYHSIENLQDARNYLKRLEQFPKRMRDATDFVQLQEKKGVRPPVAIIDRAVGALDEFLRARPAENILCEELKRKLAEVKSVDSPAAASLCREAATVLQDKVYPACSQFQAACLESRQHADSIPGVWRLPNGDQYYQYALKSYTTSSLPAQQVFDLGIKEVGRLQSLGRMLLDSIGVKKDTTFGALMQEYWAMQRQPEMADKFGYPDVPERNQMILNDYRAIVDKTWERLPALFAYVPKTKVAVEAVPAYKEASGLTYYEPASLDGKRKAAFYINMSGALGKPGMSPLTYHETIPGHHFQIATQQELTQNRLFKNLFFLSGFGEGWAMYVQSLAAEQGWLPDIYARLAEVNSQLFRAVRVVVDAGMHQQRWTREQALTYMQDNLGWSSESEIDRYSLWPGQACSYTMGKMRIMGMRERARKALGKKFDIRDFHKAVLQNGSVPLDMLEKLVDEYVEESK